METHAHELHKASGRGWKHYVYEFLMLFLAISLGFFVENLREYNVERHREKEYINSLIEDLAGDTLMTSDNIKFYTNQIFDIDTLLIRFNEFKNGYDSSLFDKLYAIEGYPDFIYSDKTIQQLKSAGNMRLIQNKIASDSIIVYDSNIRDFLIDIDMTLSIFKKNIFNLYKTIDLQKQTFDLKTHSKYELEKSGVKYLLVYDELKLAQFRNIIYLFQDACRYNVMREKKIKAHAIRVINVLKKEYHLD